MQRFQLLTVCAIALALANLLGACDDGPTRPSPSSGPPSAPPAGPVTNNVVIVGPETLPPGQSAQFSATAHQSDGSTKDVTTEVVWQAWNPSVLTLSSTGLATGRERGETGITVTLPASGRSTSTQVIVVPAGTYRLAGTVKDEGYGVGGGARVEITAGTGRGLAVSTDPSGGYRIYGVAGPIEVRVNHNGFQEVRRSLQVTGHQVADFDLVLSRPRAEVSGTYTLTVIAAPECRAALPEQARIRTYNAVVTQYGPRLTVTLGGSNFYTSHNQTFNSFRGAVEPEKVTFQLGGSLYYYGTRYDVIEALDTTTFLAMTGGVVSTVSAGRLSGALSGTLETLREASGRFETVSSCTSSGHQFVLAR
jgi:hypothetical protein